MCVIFINHQKLEHNTIGEKEPIPTPLAIDALHGGLWLCARLAYQYTYNIARE